MVTPDFDWVTYDVSVPGRAGAIADTEEVAIPDLHKWPTARDKMRILLETAAEIEHALLVQYLYASFSVKPRREGSDAAQKAALQMWRKLLVDTAKDEMGHLMTVQNLLLAVGLPPNLEREDYPPRKDLYPFTLHLEPLTQRSLAKYVTAEAPRDADIGEIIALAADAAGAAVNRVGALYGLLGVVFSTEQEVIDGGSISHDWDDTMRLHAQAAYEQDADRGAWHLADNVIDPTTLGFQGNGIDWNNGVPMHRIADRAAARNAILDVAVQGEGPSHGPLESHFDRYLNMFHGQNGVKKFPPDDFTATRPLPTDPKASSFSETRTRGWAELADQRYGLMLGFIEHYLLTSDADVRTKLSRWALDEMSQLAAMNEILVGLPGPGTVAFGLPKVLHLPTDETERWALHRARTEKSVAHVRALRLNPADAEHPTLTSLVEEDTRRLTDMPAGATV
ncbi:ferritin-like domain-containing protein [Mycolicibacterium sp. XJ870]